MQLIFKKAFIYLKQYGTELQIETTASKELNKLNKLKNKGVQRGLMHSSYKVEKYQILN